MASRTGDPLIRSDDFDMLMAESDALAALAEDGLDVSPMVPPDEAAVDEFMENGGEVETGEEVSVEDAVKELGDYLLELRQQAIDNRWGIDENTMLNIAFRHGHQFVEVDRSRRAVVETPAPPDVVRRTVNNFEPWYKAQHSKLSKGIPDHHLRPKNKRLLDRDAATYADELAEWIVPQLYSIHNRSTAAMWKLLAGSQITYVGVEWVEDPEYMPDPMNPGATLRRPDLVFEVFGPHQVWCDLRAQSIKHLRWIGVDRYEPAAEVRARYPESIQKIFPEGVLPDRGLDMHNRMPEMLSPEDPFGNGARSQTIGRELYGLEGEDDVLVAEFWARPGIVMQFPFADRLDPARVPFEVIEVDGPASAHDPMVRFPEGLHVFFTSEGHVLDFGPNPYECLPFRESKSSQSPGLFGPAPATALRPLQQAINWVESLRESGIEQTGNPKVLMPVEARARRRSFMSGVIQFIRYRANRFGAKPEYMQPPHLPTDLVQFEQHLRLVWQDIGGVHEVSQGKLPAGDISGVAISLLQEQDLNQLGYTGEDEEEAFIDVLRMALDNVQRFFPDNDPRLVELAGDAPYLLRAFMAARLKDGLNVQVVAGSSIPRSPAALEAKAKEAWQLGALVDRYGRPDWRRFQEMLGFGSADDLFAEEELDIQHARTEEDLILSLTPKQAMQAMQLLAIGQTIPFLMAQPEDDHIVHEHQHRTRLKLWRADPRVHPVHIELLRMHWSLHVMTVAPLLEMSDPAVALGAGAGAAGMLGAGQQQGETEEPAAEEAA